MKISDHKDFIRRAIELGRAGMEKGEGGPFGAVVVKEGSILAEGCNRVLAEKDPTLHAEIVAIRNACKALGSFDLQGCTIYTSCEPCPMCLGAIYWAKPDKIYYACTRKDAEKVGFDDAFIYREMKLPPIRRKISMNQLLREEALKLFGDWSKIENKTPY